MAIGVKGVFYFGVKTMEIWKDIPEYEGLYQVSNMGRVKSLDRWITQKYSREKGYYNRLMLGKIINPFSDKNGYQYVSLSKDNKVKRGCVHYLVLKTFIGERPSSYDCNHLNGQKNDNRLENLEYCTKSDNLKHSYRVLNRKHRKYPIGNQHHKAKLTDSDVINIRQLYSSEIHTQKELAQIFGVTQTNISIIVRGEGWKHLPSDTIKI
jgi:NUMOD4 motif-containing protein/HNH endonuclease